MSLCPFSPMQFCIRNIDVRLMWFKVWYASGYDWRGYHFAHNREENVWQVRIIQLDYSTPKQYSWFSVSLLLKLLALQEILLNFCPSQEVPERQNAFETGIYI